jgi:hypothetical protein
MHSMGIDPETGLPYGEKPPASTASVVALVAGFLLCLGPIAGVVAVVAAILGLNAASRDPRAVGGRGLCFAGMALGVLNLLGSALVLLWILLEAIAG